MVDAQEKNKDSRYNNFVIGWLSLLRLSLSMA